MQKKTVAIIIHEKDNVATALKPLKRDMVVSVDHKGRSEKIRILSEIPPGHKFSLTDIDEGTAIVKYGEPIGQSTAKIARGEHVHIHNVTSPPRMRGSS
ncbi:MAG TPA: UxaA family hydrolase [Syntrophorhabdaceae bacterium]|nr:UxaA family hydrolase [Syntrophorhabdaceae bacterium]